MNFWNGIDRLRGMTGQRITDLLGDAERNASLRAQAGPFLFDLSKTSLTQEALDLLLELAADVPSRRNAMFAGQRINTTEDRAVLHTALRGTEPVPVDGEDVMPGVRETLDRMRAFAEDVRDGTFRGKGGAITDVVNIGIGGSDLGPAMATLALAPWHDGPRCHFVSNVDGADWAETAKGLDPATTLVIVASKTFTTIETLTNARTARHWMAQAVPDPGTQFAALSSAEDKTTDFGIDPTRVFGFEDWVGGRYSVWGPIGLSLMIAVGPDAFDAFLRGAREMDDHFRTAPLARNLPVLLALQGIWHNQVCGYPTRAILPYDNRLARLPAYLQQLEMESNGKAVTLAGDPLPGPAGPVVWGEPGTNGQHAFYQLIHQGKTPVPCEFMVAARGQEPELDHHHRLLIANCLAQSEALLKGRSHAEARAIIADRFSGEELERQAAHRVFPGDRPSTTLIYPALTPEVLGGILALYEHRVFVEGVMLGINSFDQWGVELGKELATSLGPLVEGEDASAKDASTQALLGQLLDWRA
ncbi:glucose-6-phosphate isomerase [Jannaschia rubra]|uniref:Glucose-6-phosphate isomerase n=1 Tax=Jannaschia rubra TaxID=282197 RepID=A0A0M6XQB8_9RHOB|nr:glucose-6-phosphate isomerase [Jannaschia rubra]CTQ32872.1 Glucose-6-phosphate isomerase [Jannaschia rubra]SFG28742.1 glucose-6-phosphate isomerase [Jannaschia rubra]